MANRTITQVNRTPGLAVLLLSGGLLLLAGLLGACGVKTNPVPPHIAPPPAVNGLAGVLDQGWANLTWRMPAEESQGTATVSGFRVMRSKAAILDKPCENCTARFIVVKEIPIYPEIARLPDGQEMSYSEKLDPGFNYRFKVVTYSENGVEGGDSNDVVFEVKE